MARSRENVKVGGLRSRLGVEMLEDRVNPTSPAGFLDFAGAVQGQSDSYVAGWAYDPDTPFTPIQVHIYVWTPDAQGQYVPTFVTATSTGIYRPDVGLYAGFSVAIPSAYGITNGGTSTPFVFTAYGIDSSGSGVGTLNNMKWYTGKPGDVSVSNGAPGWGTTVLRTSGSMGGAVSSISWNGVELLNSNDHGRLAQAALFGVTNGQLARNGGIWNGHSDEYNPTEGGRMRDYVAPPAFASSIPLSARPSTSRLAAVTQINSAALTTTNVMANWLMANNGAYTPTSTGYGGVFPGLTNTSMTKITGVGWNGYYNVVPFHTEITVPGQAEDGGIRALKIFAPILYTNSSVLTAAGFYDPTNDSTPNILDTNYPNRPYPGQSGNPANFNYHTPYNYVPFLVGANNDIALAVVTIQTGGPVQLVGDNTVQYTDNYGYDTYGYNVQTESGGGYGLLSRDFVYRIPTGQSGWVSGTFTFDSFIVVGSLQMVKNTLHDMHNMGYL